MSRTCTFKSDDDKKNKKKRRKACIAKPTPFQGKAYTIGERTKEGPVVRGSYYSRNDCPEHRVQFIVYTDVDGNRVVTKCRSNSVVVYDPVLQKTCPAGQSLL